MNDGIYGVSRGGLNSVLSKALTKTFSDIDEEFYTTRAMNSIGSTASIVIIVGQHIFCANVGDSRAVLSRAGVAYNLSLDHKASLEHEKIRIQNAGGEI